MKRLSGPARIALAAVLAVVIVVIVVVATSRGDDDSAITVGPEQQPYSLRGDRGDDDALIRAAARAWRDDDAHPSQAPGPEVSALFAGTVPGEQLPVYGEDRDVDHVVVVLSSRPGTAVIGKVADGWQVFTVRAQPADWLRQPALELGGGLVLLSDRFDDVERVRAVQPARLPGYDVPDGDGAPAEPGETARPAKELSFDDSVPLVHIEGQALVRVPGSESAFDGLLWLGRDEAATDDEASAPAWLRPARPTSQAALWRSVTGRDSAAALAALDTGLDRARTTTHRIAGSITPPGAVDVQALGTAATRSSDGPVRVTALSLDTGGHHQVVTALAGRFLGQEGRSVRSMVLGERPDGVPDGPGLAAGLVESAAGDAYVVYATSPQITSARLYLGRRARSLGDHVGIVPAPASTDEAPQPVTLVGRDRSGTFWAGYLPVS